MLQYAGSLSLGTVTDADLLGQIQRGENAAFSALFTRHARTVYAYSYTRLRNRTDADEVTQEVFVILWERRQTVLLPGETIVPWLLTTTRYRILNLIRSRQRAKTSELTERSVEDVEDDTASAAELNMLAEALARVVRQLPEIDQQVYLLCVEGDTPYAEAAAQLNVTHAALRGRLSRLRARLRDEVNLLRGR